MELGLDGKIWVGGTFEDSAERWVVARFLADGTRDATFGEDGVAIIDWPGSAGAALTKIAVGPDGSTIATGLVMASAATINMGFAKLSPTGVLDPSFGANGRSQAQFGPWDATQNRCTPNALLLAADGRIVAAGQQETAYQVGPHLVVLSYWVVTRLTAGGLFDSTFNTTGYRTGEFTPLDPNAKQRRLTGIIEHPGGGYIGIGDYRSEGGVGFGALIRISTNGEIDSSWGASGHAAFYYGSAASASLTASAVVDRAHRLVVLGTAELLLNDQVGISRILLDPPTYDPYFPGGGATWFSLPSPGLSDSRGRDIAVDLNGRILAIGTNYGAGQPHAGLVRILPGLPFEDGFESGLIEAWSGNVGSE